MTYPPGGYPPSPPQGYEPVSPPPRSPWSSPLVIAAIVIGVIVVIGAGVSAYLLTGGSDSPTASSTSSSTESPSTHTVTNTIAGTGPDRTAPTTPPSTSAPSETTAPRNPTVSGTDAQGFLSGPRCNADGDPAIAIGRTNRSQVVICQVGDQTGRWYYKGSAESGTIEIDYPSKVGDAFVAQNGTTTYTLSPSALVIASDGATLSTEPMVEYWAAS